MAQVADHLLVIDPAAHVPHGIVATYRLLDAAAAARAGGFYWRASSISGRCCARGSGCSNSALLVDPGWRSGAVMQLLWRGIAEVVQARGIDVMFGCASLHGADVARHAAALSLLASRHLAPRALRPQALAMRHVDLRQLPEGAYDPRAAFALPPLLEGYLPQVGGWVGDGAVIDHDFNTVDVAVVVPTEGVTARYAQHYDTVRVA
jgi:putative hemolysin